MKDRTGELRKLGFPGRRLGTEQMTTDTAARVTRMVVQDKSTSESSSQSHLRALVFSVQVFLLLSFSSDANTSIAERLEDIPYIDRPDIDLPARFDAEEGGGPNESVSMPFRYVRGEDGEPVMPKVSVHS